MARSDERPATSSDPLPSAIPRQREASEQARILADDELIDAIGAGRIADDEHAEPVVSLLVRWRRLILSRRTTPASARADGRRPRRAGRVRWCGR